MNGNKEIAYILGVLSDTYAATQNLRIKADNRLDALHREDKLKGASFDWLKKRTSARYEEIEEALLKDMKTTLKEHPLWNGWLKEVPGIGERYGAGLIGYIRDINRFDNVSKLHAYCGLTVGYYLAKCEAGHKYVLSSQGEGKQCSTFKDDKGTICGKPLATINHVEGSAIRKVQGYKMSWNPKLQTLCSHKLLGSNFLKVKRGYRLMYDDFREFYDKKYIGRECNSPLCKYPTKGRNGSKPQNDKLCKPAHRMVMAQRKTVKLFLSHLWMVWRVLEGLPVRTPYALDKLGHTSLILPEMNEELATKVKEALKVPMLIA